MWTGSKNELTGLINKMIKRSSLTIALIIISVNMLIAQYPQNKKSVAADWIREKLTQKRYTEGYPLIKYEFSLFNCYATIKHFSVGKSGSDNYSFDMGDIRKVLVEGTTLILKTQYNSDIISRERDDLRSNKVGKKSSVSEVKITTTGKDNITERMQSAFIDIVNECIEMEAY